MNTTLPPRIFISYSHQGRGPEWRAKLLKALKVFEQHHLLDVWEDGKIRISTAWNDDITQAMSSAGAAVFLLTPEALESEFILKTELPFLQNRWEKDRIPVFSVVCELCRWKEQEASKWLQAIQSPAGAEPLAGFPEALADHHLRHLATAIAEELSRTALDACSGRREEAQLRSTVGEVRTSLDKFPLTRGPGLREDKLIGREQELALLDLAFASSFGVAPLGGPGSRADAGLRTAIVSLVAWGGVGKTMLVQHWLQRLQREGWFGARRVYAWSFYSQGTKEDRQASEDTFLAHALEWFGVQCEPTLSPWDKGRLLADAVARERTLLILDGIEPLQYPPGPMGGQLRAPGVQSLLKQLARKASSEVRSQKPELSNSLCLVTTREPLTDLADFQRREGSPWGSVLRVDLGNLTDEAGAVLLHHAGANRAGAAEIKPDDKELLAASREVDGHALTLNLLGRFLARAHGGDIRRRDLVKFEEADRKEQGGTTFKMLAAFENWFANEGDIEARALTVLRLLGLFDRPADTGCVAALRQNPFIAGLTEPLFTQKRDSTTGQSIEQPLSDKAWNDAIHFLADFGLVLVHADALGTERLLDCHPLIRDYFANHLCKRITSSWVAGHNRLFDYLRGSTIERPDTVATLEPLYQSIVHGCAAGRYQEAFREVFMNRVRRGERHFSVYELGAYSSDLSALSCFYLDVSHTPVQELSKEDQSWIQHAVASALRSLGRLEESVTPMQAGRKAAIESKDWYNSAVRASNEALLVADLGRLDEACALAASAVTFADDSPNPGQRILRRNVHAYLLCESGKTREGFDLFQQGDRILCEFGPAHGRLIINGRYYGRLMVEGVSAFHRCDCLLGIADILFWRIRLFPSSTSLVFAQEDVGACPLRAIKDRLKAVRYRSRVVLRVDEDRHSILPAALHRLTLAWVDVLWCAFSSIPGWHSGAYAIAVRLTRLFSNNRAKLAQYRDRITRVIADLRAANNQNHVARGLLLRARYGAFCDMSKVSLADLDEAWDIAERGPMRLHLADIHLYRARLFFRERSYPWKSPQDDLAAAEKLINDCGYHRRDEELADAKRAILGIT